MPDRTLADTTIRQDAHGRYCLNDLHKAAVAAGANKRAKEPNKFFRSPGICDAVKLLNDDLTAESDTQPGVTLFEAVNAVRTGSYDQRGTYVVRELVIAYAMYVSAEFYLKVIRTFDAVLNGQHAMPHIQATKFWDALRPHWAQIAELALCGFKNKHIALAVQRSAGSVGRCLRRMFEVGYLNPVAVFKARLHPATAARWAIAKPLAAQWGRLAAPQPQQAFDFAGVPA